jgi:hypothetical protein
VAPTDRGQIRRQIRSAAHNPTARMGRAAPRRGPSQCGFFAFQFHLNSLVLPPHHVVQCDGAAAHLEASASAGASAADAAANHVHAPVKGESASSLCGGTTRAVLKSLAARPQCCPQLGYYVTLWAQDDEAQFTGPHANLYRNGAPIAARVAPFLQLASLAGVHVGRLNAVLVGHCPALPCLARPCCCAAPQSLCCPNRQGCVCA